jgi:catechol-2,3-dioxygenase
LFVIRVVEIIADLHVADVESAREFYASYLGLSTEEFNLGWVARFTSPVTGAHVQVVTRDATASEDRSSRSRSTTSTRRTRTHNGAATRSCTR